MKAIVITTPGGPEVLKLQQVEDPVLKDDQVLIKVEATALNRADTLQRQGKYPPPKGESEFPGLECSGVVEKVGNNVSRWKVGDQKCLSDESLVIPMKELRLDDKLNFVEEPVEIMDREVKQLRQSRIPIVKVRWNSKRGPEFTWEREDEIRAKYPHLFSNITSKSN
ncbi:putative reverse transcriptase domain-containing protein [Tanacetum coccineum]|uniref:Reverse transcriptase domain-containing protein n=1 Tax=Tanacetum coccineum TaxID=301880 RepID=A0ABQ4Z5U7_9ASTR